MRRIAAVMFAAMIAAAFTTLLTAPLAAAASGGPPDDALLLVSQDGQTFTGGATWTLFPDAGPVVPSDVISDHVWVQNAADEPGRLQIRLDDLHADDRDLVEGMTVWATVSGLDDRTVALGDVVGGCVVLHSGLQLQPGETAEVRTTVAIDPALGERPGDDGNAGGGGTVDFVLRATLTDATVPIDASPGEACSDVVAPQPSPTHTPMPTPTGAPLPQTGADAPLAALGLGMLGAGTGLAILWFTHARRRPDGHA